MGWENQIIIFLWVAFAIYWLVAAVGVKKSKNTFFWTKAAGFRIAIIILALLFLHTLHVKDVVRVIYYQHFQNLLLSIIGVVLAVLGMAFAFWARVHIGKNWGQPMSQKENPELVTSGPYVYVRHPIYSGIGLAMLGTVLVEGIFWLIPFFIIFGYFIYSAGIEEKNMTKEFPKAYPEYVKRSKKLIPFLY